MDLKISRTLKSSLLYVMVLIFLGFILLPYIWQFLTSIKPLAEISAIPAKWVPSKINVEYYFNVFQKHPFARYLFNSVIVATMTTVVSILIGASASYALARLRFKGKKVILLSILTISMFPTISTVSPLFLILKNMNLLNTYAGLVIPYTTFALPMAIWLLTNFFSQLPKGFEEAATIDGCSRLQTFFRIMLPLIKPATFSVALLVFINAWNEYIYSLTFMTDDSMRTVPVGIALFPSNYELPWGDMAAASIVVTVPLIALVLIFQQKIIAGLTSGGIKG
ncbi:MAG: carbohydrate ABC transporter permease [Paenibacillus macerans]|uniref:ABC transporter permease subunit n=1 Tax=Paenibacillus macerans TaxID=44252 RepID=A0A090Z6R1_PAEMA|nr:carbohydrate ABC transporter permease [Paenibacillus macerans]KFN05890.1 binding--dependent transport system inner membrane component family protein [Paenibacillus macerans]MBS5910035.1 carbohydrate ABC transporter permease [Paenibacillus macerans]MCY7560166.1 carbohydrate ABC transporter permease [Paenibacillus macerans]MDU7475805.1 carbohydrate ABC transporter permease [Paenibacillus macerans]MEC0135538.1 carbohydrate ABC transporter permease [Paenibacillus macerans]